MIENQLAPIRPLCRRQIFPNTAAMNLARRNLENEWSPNIVAQKEDNFEILVGD